MTRRAVKFPTKFDWGFYRYPLKPVTQEGYRAFVELLDEDEFSFEPERYASSQYAVGEIVAIAQTYNSIVWHTNPNKPVLSCYIAELLNTKGSTNKMFVKPEYMPHHIQITSIRVQNLQDISDEDCLKEGVKEGEFINTWDRFYFESWGDVPNPITFKTPRKAFAALIDKVSSKGTWESNPLVWVYEFKLID